MADDNEMDSLPDEIIVSILIFLTGCGVREIINIGLVSGRFHTLIHNSQIWRELMKKDFPDNWCPTNDILEEYKQLQGEQKRVDKFREIIKQSDRFMSNIELFNDSLRTMKMVISLISPYHLPLIKTRWGKLDFITSHGKITYIGKINQEYFLVDLCLLKSHFNCIDDFLVGAVPIIPQHISSGPFYVQYKIIIISMKDFTDNLMKMGFIQMMYTRFTNMERVQVSAELFGNKMIVDYPPQK